MNVETNHSDLRVKEQQGKTFTREEREELCLCEVARGEGGSMKWGFERKSTILSSPLRKVTKHASKDCLGPPVCIVGFSVFSVKTQQPRSRKIKSWINPRLMRYCVSMA